MFTAEFLITSLVVVLIPGTGVIFTVSTGLSQGRRASFFASVAYLWYVYYIAAYIICVDRLLQTVNKPDTEVAQLHPSVYLQQNGAPRIGQG